MIDGIEVEVDSFIELQNLNQATTVMNTDSKIMQQHLAVDIVS